MTAEIEETGSEDVLLRADKAGVAILTLNRPQAFNALSLDLIQALQVALDAFAEDEETRVIVLAAAGEAFCTGHDLKQMRSHSEEAYFQDLFMSSARVMETRRSSVGGVHWYFSVKVPFTILVTLCLRVRFSAMRSPCASSPVRTRVAIAW